MVEFVSGEMKRGSSSWFDCAVPTFLLYIYIDIIYAMFVALVMLWSLALSYLYWFEVLYCGTRRAPSYLLEMALSRSGADDPFSW